MISPQTPIKDVLTAHPETGAGFERSLEIPAIALFSVVIWCTLDVRVVTSPATDEITLESRVGALIERRPELLAVRVVS